MAIIPIARPSRGPHELPSTILYPRVRGTVRFCDVHTIHIDFLILFSESLAILRLFGARRLSQQYYPFFPEP
jgi:hypothetical protein